MNGKTHNENNEGIRGEVAVPEDAQRSLTAL